MVEAKEKSVPFKDELCEHWKALKVQEAEWATAREEEVGRKKEKANITASFETTNRSAQKIQRPK